MNTWPMTIRDLFLLLGLCTSAYYCRPLRSTTSYGNNRHSFSKSYKSNQKLQEPLQKTIKLIEQMAVHTTNIDQQTTLEAFCQVALALQEEYAKTSPVLILLGPIGAASTVIKENKIYKELVELLQEIAQYSEEEDSLEIYDCGKILEELENSYSQLVNRLD